MSLLHLSDSIPAENKRLMRFATYASVSVASIIVCMKLYAWLSTDSVSILSSLADSVLDVLTSMINFIAVHYALQPPDKEHRFGHGKAEHIAALTQAAFIVGSAIFICSEASIRFFQPQPIHHSDIGILVMVIATLLTGVLVGFQLYVVKRTHSHVIEADSLHYLTDFLSNIAVIVVLVLANYVDWFWLDPLLALLIAGYLLLSAIRLGKRAFNNLMDHELDPQERKQIVAIVMEHPEVKGIHDLKTRVSGTQIIIQFHLEMDGSMTLYKAHMISDAVEEAVLRQYPNADIIIHQDPDDIDEVQVKEIIQ